jgi:hypothetical protein
MSPQGTVLSHKRKVQGKANAHTQFYAGGGVTSILIKAEFSTWVFYYRHCALKVPAGVLTDAEDA